MWILKIVMYYPIYDNILQIFARPMKSKSNAIALLEDGAFAKAVKQISISIASSPLRDASDLT